VLRYCYIVFLFLFFFCGCKQKEKQIGSAKSGSKTSVSKNKPASSKTKTGSGSELQQKLGVSNKEIKENELYSFINNWYGTPYKYGGCQKTGVDCSCFVNLVYDKVYHKKIARTASDMFKECDEINIEDAAQGDLLFFKIQGKLISHVGIFVRKKLFVHASTSQGVIINSLDEAYYKKYFYCAGKLKDV
jgi:murein DD-endopeptidase / murein LD-carboxypeptidase